MTAAPPPKPAPQAAPLPAAVRGEYLKQMQAAAGFEKQQKYAEAVRAYQEALRLLPGGAAGGVALRNAQFAQAMAEGRKALTGKRFPDAVREFERALQLSPANPEATKALQQAKEGKPS
jgi:tetratricopeptide (TPR) repeat protein